MQVTKCKRGGIYYLRYPREADPEGKSRRVSLKTSDPVVAEVRRREEERRLNLTGKIPLTDREHTMRYSAFVDLFLRFKEGQGRSRNTLDAYKASLDNFGCYLGRDLLLGSITVEMLEGFAAARRTTRYAVRKKPKLGEPPPKPRPGGAAEKTIRNELSVLATALDWAWRREYIAENPAARLEMPRVSRIPTAYFRDADFTKLMAAIDDEEFKDVVALYYLTGMRRSEGLKIRIQEHIDFERGVLMIPQPKSRDFKVLPLFPALRRVLERLILMAGDREFLLDFDEDTLTRRFKFFVVKAKLPGQLHFHSIRHTFGTRLGHQGVPFPVLQALMGHRDPESTKRYVHPFEGDRNGVLQGYDLPGNN